MRAPPRSRPSVAPERRRLAALVLVAAFAVAPRSRAAGPELGEDPRTTAPASDARQHFELSLTHYREGHYRAAIAELEAALTLDPASKDLLFNLAMVHEKLGQLEQAISALERYAELEKDPADLKWARLSIARMRGALAEFGPPQVAARVPMPPPIVPPIEHREKNVALIATTSITAVAAVVGVIFGIRALALRPGSDPSTGPGTSVEQLRTQQERAEASALVADISFAVGLVSGAASAVLWTHDACPRSARLSPPGLVLRGAF
jgi:tetratricopeptide (TPR) repeat protein